MAHRWRSRARRGRKSTFYNPSMWGKSINPHEMYGKSYMEYTVGEPGQWITSFPGGTVTTENPIELKPGCYMQSVNDGGIQRPAWNAISLNSPVIQYSSPANNTAWLYNNPTTNGFNNINQGINKYNFMSILETYCKITFLPAINVPTVSDPTELGVNDLAYDSLCVWFMYPNEKEPDNYVLYGADTSSPSGGVVPPALTKELARDPIRFGPATGSDEQTGAMIARDPRIKKVPLNTPNTIGGGRTVITAKWRARGGRRSNVCDFFTTTYSGKDVRYYGFPRNMFSAENTRANVDHKWRLYWALGSDMGKSSVRYQYRFKIQMWCKYVNWDLIENVPKYIGMNVASNAVPFIGPTNEKEKEPEVTEEDEPMDIGESNSMPSTPVLEQMFSEFARLQEKMAKSSSVTFNK